LVCNIRVKFPVVDSDMDNHIELFKFHIMQYIFANRIYKVYDLEYFHKQLISKNKKFISEEEINEVYNAVKVDLDE
jgi:hypothetical protein